MDTKPTNCNKSVSLLLEKHSYFYRGRNNAQSLDMTEHICRLTSHNFFQFQTLSGHFVNIKPKIIKFLLGFKANYQRSRNNEPKRSLFTT